MNISGVVSDAARVERAGGWRITALLVLGALCILIGNYVAPGPEITVILGLAILIPMIGIIHLSPPMAALAVVYAWPLRAELSVFGLPGISAVSAWTILWLLLLH